MNAFKAARFFDPAKVYELKPTSTNIDDLKVFPFFTQPVLEGSKAELPL